MLDILKSEGNFVIKSVALTLKLCALQLFQKRATNV